jgi:hypothetical protein
MEAYEVFANAADTGALKWSSPVTGPSALAGRSGNIPPGV